MTSKCSASWRDDAREHALADGVAVGKQLRRHQLVDDDDACLRAVVGVAERAAGDDRRLGERKVVRLHEVGDRLLELRRIGGRFERAKTRERIAAVERNRACRGRIDDAGNRLQPLEHVALERLRGLRCPARGCFESGTSRRCSGSNPGFAFCSAMKVRIIRPDPTSRTKASATSATTAPSRSQRPDDPPTSRAARAEHVHHIRTRRLPRRQHAEDQRRRKRSEQP